MNIRIDQFINGAKAVALASTFLISPGVFAEDEFIVNRGEVPERATGVFLQGHELQRGSQGKRDRYVVPAGTESLRIRLYLKAFGEGFGTLITWEDLQIAAEFQDSIWTLFSLSADSSEWVETEFALMGESFPGFVDLDFARAEDQEGQLRALFVNGLLIANGGRSIALPKNTASHFEVHQLDFADIAVERVMRNLETPIFAKRGLDRIRSEEELEAIHLTEPGMTKELATADPELQLLSDHVRRQLFDPIRFSRFPKPGDLSFEEEAWYLTKAVNRSYYKYDAGFRVNNAQLDENRLILKGADYLPVLEGRSWSRPLVYENWEDNYIEKISGYIVPESSGDYVFWLSADEVAGMYLSGSRNEESLRLVASVTSPSGYRWDKEASQSSGQITLQEGVAYYFEIWHAERLGDDYLKVAWTLPNGKTQYIPSKVLSSDASGAPGSFPRKGIYPKDESLLPLEVDMPLQLTGLTPLSYDLGNGTDPVWGMPYLDGNAPIVEKDFDDYPWLWHAWEGNGFGRMYSTDTTFPSILVPDLQISPGPLGGWGWYLEESAEPQVFYKFNPGVWLTYYSSGVQGSGSGYVQVAAIPHKWDFEDSLVDWISSPAWWQRDLGGTSSSLTGPNHDNTLKTTAGYYVYLETSSGSAYTPGVETKLEGPRVFVEETGTMLTFYYHMYGRNMGTLYVLVEGVDGQETSLEIASGPVSGSNESSRFLRADVDLSAWAGDSVKITLMGKTPNPALHSNQWEGDMAIDDVMIYHIGFDTDRDGMPDGFEFLYGFDPFVAGDPSSWDGDSDLFSQLVENISGSSGIDGFNPASWTENSSLQQELADKNYDPVILVPGKGIYGVNPGDLTLTEVAF